MHSVALYSVGSTLNNALMHHHRSQQGFTLIEILITLGIIALLAGIVIVAVNPTKQFAQARNAERQAHIATILNAIGQRMADNTGIFEGSFDVAGVTYTCDALPASRAVIKSGGVDLAKCLVPTYLSIQIPVDPNGGTWTSVSSYDTTYEISMDTLGRVTVCAPNAAGETSVPDAGELCVTR